MLGRVDAEELIEPKTRRIQMPHSEGDIKDRGSADHDLGTAYHLSKILDQTIHLKLITIH